MQPLIIPPDSGPDYDWTNDHIFVKTPWQFTDGRVTLVEDTLKPGFRLPRHHHRSMVEIFYILHGEVRFAFDDETATAVPGTVVNVPIGTWHEVTCEAGGRLITVFTPGGFDDYLAELARMTPQQLADEDLMTGLSERYDTWTR